jgi:hypothetical protein
MTIPDRTDENSGIHRESASRIASVHSRPAYSAPSLVRLDLEQTAGAAGQQTDGIDGAS